jgi:hypothetical protein
MLRPATLFVGVFFFLVFGAAVTRAQDAGDDETPKSKTWGKAEPKPQNLF